MAVKRKRLSILEDGAVIKEETDNTAKHKNKSNKDIFRGLNLISEMGFVISLPLVGSTFLGLYLDRRFLTYPKLTLLFIFIGMIIAFINLWSILKKYTS